ncbi:hypothetical protein LAV82_22785 [Bacillus sp. ILBB4]|nr:hypothetical protein [Bacillus sp. ILBB4]
MNAILCEEVAFFTVDLVADFVKLTFVFDEEELVEVFGVEVLVLGLVLLDLKLEVFDDRLMLLEVETLLLDELIPIAKVSDAILKVRTPANAKLTTFFICIPL